MSIYDVDVIDRGLWVAAAVRMGHTREVWVAYQCRHGCCFGALNLPVITASAKYQCL